VEVSDGGRPLANRCLIFDDLIDEIVVYCNPEDRNGKAKEKFMDRATGLEMELSDEPVLAVEHFSENYKQWGCALTFVTDSTQEGSQFVKGFGGIGGIL
jgi:peptide chain release factor subunit 1